MNEQIYTIAEQVGATRWNDELNGNSIEFSPEQLEKFAELIVRETAKEMSHQLYWHGVEQSNNPSFYTAIQKTLEHFGVEE